MDQEQWDLRYKFFYRQTIDELNNGYFKGDMHDAWVEARRRTTVNAGPRPDGDGPSLVDVIKAPVVGVKKGVKAVKSVLNVVQWLNGKKTIVGVLTAGLAEIITAVLPYLPELLPALGVQGATVAIVLSVLGKALIVIGLIHKAIKYKGAKGGA